MLQPDVSRLRGRRDVAIITLLLATGLREGDAAQLEISDRYQSYGGPALRMKAGKGATARMALFGDMLWARQITWSVSSRTFRRGSHPRDRRGQSETPENIVNNYRFYSVFMVTDKFRVRDKPREIGTIPDAPDLDSTLVLAGFMWRVLRVDTERRIVEVARARG